MFNQDALVEEMDGLKRFAWRLTGNRPEAEDLTQATILRALEKKHLFKEGSNLFSWTSKIMYNLFVTAYRRKTKFETQYDPEDFIQKESVAANQETKMAFQEVDEAMGELSKNHRQILIMVSIKGMQYAEVSEALQVPIGTVRSRVSRAREALQDELSHNNKSGTNILPDKDRSYAIAA